MYKRRDGFPVPTWNVEVNPDDPHATPSLMDLPVRGLLKTHRGLTFRGVGIDRLSTILATGLDVHPTDSVIYCDAIQKAIEYGDVVMAFRHRDEDDNFVLSRAIVTINPETSIADAASRRLSHPHVLKDENGVVTLCRIEPEHQARINYLGAHGYFITGSPWDALVGLFLFGDAADHAAAGDSVHAHSATTS